MVYDEGFSFDVGIMSFFAFSKYTRSDSKAESRCYSTCTGWYVTKDGKKRGCYQAKKLDVSDPEQVTFTSDQKGLNILQPSGDGPVDFSFKSIDIEDKKYGIQDSLSPTTTSFLAEREGMMSRLDATFTKHHLYIDKLNTIPKSWTAALHNGFENLSIKQLNKMAGIPRMSRFRFKSKDITPEDVSEYPKSFNWKEKLKPAGSQGNCGSCYAYSTTRMLESRLKILYDHDVDLSVQHSLDCSIYNQGCSGGYPYLVMKYGNEFEYIPESCKPYTEVTGECSKGNTCNINDLKYIYKSRDYKYVGGSYGKCSEKSMLNELYHNGPMVVSFEPDYNFMLYKTGIYHTISDDTWITHAVPKPEWEKVDHSVLLVGWGEDNGDKYWLLQNTWGPSWGEEGFFRMRRGKDEFGIESICEAAVPYIVDNKTGKEVAREQIVVPTQSLFEVLK
jgi:cathepsin C